MNEKKRGKTSKVAVSTTCKSKFLLTSGTSINNLDILLAGVSEAGKIFTTVATCAGGGD